MPNRIIKESICASDSVNELGFFEQAVFVRLIVTVDDFGRYDARHAVLRARLFPLSNVTDKQIGCALDRLQTAGIVFLYDVAGKPYLQFANWSKHQQIRNKRSKFPSPDSNCVNLQSIEINRVCRSR